MGENHLDFSQAEVRAAKEVGKDGKTTTTTNNKQQQQKQAVKRIKIKMEGKKRRIKKLNSAKEN